MSEKVIKHMVVDTIIILVVTALFLLLKHYIGFVSEMWIRNALTVILYAFYAITDGIVVFFFMFYWWSDVKWTRIKNGFKK